MKLIFDDVLFRENSAAAAARARNSVPYIETTKGKDVAVALHCIGAFQDYRTKEQLLSLEDEATAAPLMAAARTLISISDELRGAATLLPDVADELAMHSAVAFAMQGNFPSARAAMHAAEFRYRSGSRARRIAWSVCDPECIEQLILLADADSEEVGFLRTFKAGMMTAEERHREKARELLRLSVVSHDVSDTSLLLSTQVALEQAFRLAISNLVSSITELPDQFLLRLIEAGRWTLLPPQRKLIVESGVAGTPGNVLLNLPTSTGKTLIAEACLVAGLASNSGVSFFIAPYVAIGEQVLLALKSHVPEDVEVVAMFGGFKSDYVEVCDSVKQIAVATPERFDGWLRSSPDLSRLITVVFDEVHFIENGSRGARLEGVISRLRLLQAQGLPVRVVSLSAVLPEAGLLRDWLHVPIDSFHRQSWRPTARRLAICRWNGQLSWIHATDALRPASAQFGTPIGNAVSISLPEEVRPFYGEFVPDSHSIASARNVAAIAVDLALRLRGPGLVICSRRVDTRRVASVLANDLQAPPSSMETLTALSDQIVQRYPWLSSLSGYVKQGVAYHNSTLPFDVRRWVEQALRNGHLKFVVATTTLAEGADLPFRWTLVSHFLRGIYKDAPCINPLTFRNIAGRSGRAGSYTEGDTILYENLLGPKGEMISSESGRQDAIRFVLTDNSPLASSLTALDGIEDQESLAVEAMFSSQLLAAIPENATSDDIVSLLSLSTYAGTSGKSKEMKNIFQRALESMLDAEAIGGALAVQNSPVSLTELGIAANRSGFSPATVRAIVAFLNEENLPTEPHLIMAVALHRVALSPEQNSAYLRKIFSKERHNSFMKKEDLSSTLLSWVAGMTPRDIFEQLPQFKKSKSAPESVEKQFEDFVGFSDSVLRSFCPWLMRAIDTLKSFGNEQAQRVDWRMLAQALEAREQRESTAPSEGE